MTTVCFTGRGYNGGTFVIRDDWSRMAREMGWYTVDDVTSATFLVASRTDTSKARTARLLGRPVLTYDQFLVRYRDHLLDESRTRQGLPSNTRSGRTDAQGRLISQADPNLGSLDNDRPNLAEAFTPVPAAQSGRLLTRSDTGEAVWVTPPIQWQTLPCEPVQPVAPAKPVFGGRRAINLDD